MNSSYSIIALIALLLSSCAAQQPACSICGDGMEVGNPIALVVFPGQSGQIPCGVLENMGIVGLIPPAQCAVLPQLISAICECQPIDVTTTTVATAPPFTTTATKPGKSTKSSKSESMMIANIDFVSDTTSSTSSGFNNSNLITLLSWIVYSETSTPDEDEERAEQVDSLDAQSIQEETNEVLKDIRGELIELNENFKNMGK